MSKYLFIFLISFICLIDIDAKHIIGGDVHYECLGVDTIARIARMRFEFQMYKDGRDATGADFDGAQGTNFGAEFGVYRRRGSTWVFVKKTAPLRLTSRARVLPNEQPCLITPPAIFVERGLYEFEMDLDFIDDDYMIAYQRCCRSEAISNLVTPGEFGAVFAIELTPTAVRSCNHSPIFNEFPPLVICAGFELIYDHSARDREGDQITYGFCTPLSGGGNPGPGTFPPRSDCRFSVIPDPAFCGPDNWRQVSFVTPTFTTLQPMAGNPVVSIDPNTGLITGVPEIVGEHVMAVCAQEFRDGVLLTTIRRDFQFIVSRCEKAVDAIIASDRTTGDKQFEVVSCGDFNVNFVNLSVREQDIREYRWEFNLGNQVETSAQKNPSFTFPNFGIYDVKMILNPGVSNCTDSAFITVKVFPGLEAEYEFSYDTCVAGPVQFQDLSFTDALLLTRREWTFGDGTGRIGLNPSHYYNTPGTKRVTLEVEDNNGCIDRISKNVEYNPAPSIIIVEPSSFIGCKPAVISFNNLSEPIDDRYQITWNFGDGSTGENRNHISPVHTYPNEGIFSVSVDIVSPIGCQARRIFPNWIRVLPGPDADFVYSPEEVTSVSNQVSFTNLTLGADGYVWDFDGQAISFERNPIYLFRDTGIHVVTLQAVSANGCLDTISKIIDVIPVADLFYPNAFTPNGDGRNDTFRGAGMVDLVTDYRLKIFDRWGMEIFTTTDPREGWNGRLNNTGQEMSTGVYMFLATFREPRGERRESRGFATLIR